MPEKSAPRRFFEKWAALFNVVAVVGVGAMLFLTVTDITGSKLRMPVPAGFYITGLILLIIASFGTSQAELRGRHIRIDIFLAHASPKVKAAFGIFNNLVTAIVVGLVIFTTFRYAITVYTLKLVTLDLHIPYYPFTFLLSFGFVPLFFIFLVEAWESIRKVQGK